MMMTKRWIGLPTCTCGREAPCEEQLELHDCDHCGYESCSGCRHTCEWCGDTGCEQCMTATTDGWVCGDDCAEALKQYQDGIDAKWEADREAA